MAFYLPSQQLILSLHGALHSAQPTDTSATCRQFFDSMRNISACDHADKRRRKNVDYAQVGSCLELTKRVTNESIITLGNVLNNMCANVVSIACSLCLNSLSSHDEDLPADWINTGSFNMFKSKTDKFITQKYIFLFFIIYVIFCKMSITM